MTDREGGNVPSCAHGFLARQCPHCKVERLQEELNRLTEGGYSEQERKFAELSDRLMEQEKEVRDAWLDGYQCGIDVACDHASEARRAAHEYLRESGFAGEER